MKAVALREFGPSGVLQVLDLPAPAPAPGQIVVAVSAATVNPTDLLLRSGEQAAAMGDLVPPYVPGMELAGIVHDIGDGSSGLSPGQPVMGVVNPRRAQGGAQASLVAIDHQSVVALPSSMDLVAAATLPMNGLTAIKALEALELHGTGTVLVTGAVGAVGGYAVQAASAAGLTVLADGFPADEALLASLGAAIVLPRGHSLVGAVRAAAPAGVDGVIDCAQLGATAWWLVREGAVSVSVRGLPGGADARLRHRAISVTRHMDDMAALTRVRDLAAAGVLTPRVAHVLPVAAAARAHDLVERGGLRGRVVLDFRGPETDASAAH